jgi:septum formation topological specificity factor MinE
MTLAKAAHPFQFVTQLNMVWLTGRSARTLHELLHHLRQVPLSVIYHHTHHFLKRHAYLSPEPPNDFAIWVSDVMQEDRLGEELAAIDTVRHPSLAKLAEKIIQTIERYIKKNHASRVAPDSEEFHFMKTQSFNIPTPFVVSDLAEFLEAVKKVSNNSLYHHMFEAPLRLGKETNDFSLWLKSELGEVEIAATLAKMDPYSRSMEKLRSNIIRVVEKRLDSKSMEVARGA